MRHVNPQQPEIKYHPQGGGAGGGGDDALPANLDPVRHRIVATHFFGWQPVGEVAARLVLRKLPDLLNEACDG